MSAIDYFEEIKLAITANSIQDFLEVLYNVKESQLKLENILNFVNAKRQTVLHLASARLHDEFVRILLLNGADPNLSDVNGRTPLLELVSNLHDCQCECCIRKAVRCIRYLGEFGANMDAVDKMGDTALQLSAMCRREAIALELLNQGASLTNSYAKKSIMEILLERLPDIILPIFDRAIVVDLKQKHSPDFQLSFDMSVILPSPFDDSCVTKKYEKSCREMGLLRRILKTSGTRDMNTYRAILQHPIVHVFTDIKWDRLKLMYFGYLAFQLNLLFWYVMFLFMIIFIDCSATMPTTIQNVNNRTGFFSSVKGTLFSPTPSCDIQIYTKVMAMYILMCTFISISKEIFHFFTDFWTYVTDVFNYVHWIGICTMAATTIISLDPIPLFLFWILPLASFGVGICWFQLFLHLGEMPTLAIYVDMFSKVAVNFCISLVMYSPLIIAFTMSYFMLFPSDTNLLDIPIVTLRILTMMLGELNFETLFAPDQWVRNVFLAYVWYAIFIVIISMILMNLLVGLAVNDIGGCRKDSELVVMKRKIRYLNYLEKTYYFSTLFTPTRLKIYLRNRVNVVRPGNPGTLHCNTEKETEKKYFVQVYPNKPKDPRFLNVTTVAIRCWLIKKQNSRSSLDTFCRQKHVNFEINRSHHQPENELRTGSSKSSYAKKLLQESKHLLKMENSLVRLETRILDLTAKVDEILTSNKVSNHELDN